MVQKSDTAVLMFSNTPQYEARKKTFWYTKSQNEAIATLFFSETILTVQKTQLPYFLIDESKQRGKTFGERLQNAFKDIFEKGYEKVIAVGCDTPNLETKHILQTYEGLKTAPSVLGPSHDGGVYILGFQKICFDALDFKKIKWQTENVFTELTQSIDNQYITLEKLKDIDSKSDLINVLSFLKTTVKKAICEILVLKTFITNKFYFFDFKPIFLRSSSLRAPPFS